MSKRKEQSPGPNLHGGAQDERTRTMKSAEIVALAVQGVPGTAFQTRQVADMAVTNMALRIRNQVADGSLAMRTLEAVPILATIEEIALEESSKRYLVTFRPDRVREGYEPTETIRTDRTDGWRGDSVRDVGRTHGAPRASLQAGGAYRQPRAPQGARRSLRRGHRRRQRGVSGCRVGIASPRDDEGGDVAWPGRTPRPHSRREDFARIESCDRESNRRTANRITHDPNRIMWLGIESHPSGYALR